MLQTLETPDMLVRLLVFESLHDVTSRHVNNVKVPFSAVNG
jgi:hypothetical protein